MRRVTVLLGLVAALEVVGSATRADAADQPAVVALSIDAGRSGPIVDRHIFGQFAEHLGRGIYDGIWVGEGSKIPNTRGIRNDVVEALKAIHIPVVRWPGGCFADKYHWRDGIGPRDKRPVTLNPDWGGVEEPDGFGSHEFFDFINQINSESYVSVNVGSGDVREAADWLQYLTSPLHDTLANQRRANGREAPYKVEFLGIGNESFACGGSMSPQHYVDEFKHFATFMIDANFNPEQADDAHKMKLVASGPDAELPDTYDYTEAVMKAYQSRVYSWNLDGLSLHRYTGTHPWPPHVSSTGFGEDDYAALLKDTLPIEGMIAKHIAIMDKYDPDKKVGLYIDEWGAWLAPEPGTNPHFLYQQNSQRDAILAGLNLDIFMRHADRVRMSNIAQMINVLQAMILTQGDKIVLTPTYYVYKLYVPFQDATALPVKFDAGVYTFKGTILPRWDAFAVRAKDGSVYMALINIDPSRPLRVDVSLFWGHLKVAIGETLTAPRVDSINTFNAPNVVIPHEFETKAKDGRLLLSLPRASVTVVRLQ